MYLEQDEEGSATAYDVEPDNMCDAESLKSLPRRTRFYHSKIDGKSLKSGEGYSALKDVYVIMIMTTDPFGKDYIRYTIKNGCVELPKLPYEDGTRTIYLYTNGKRGDISEELKQLLKYLEHTTAQNATTEKIQEIDKMIEIVKRDEEVELEFMKIFEREEMLIRQGQKMEQEKVREAEKKVKAAEEKASLAKIQTKREDVLELLSDLGEIPPGLAEQIQKENDMEVLSGWHKAVARAETVEEFIEKYRE